MRRSSSSRTSRRPGPRSRQLPRVSWAGPGANAQRVPITWLARRRSVAPRRRAGCRQPAGDVRVVREHRVQRRVRRVGDVAGTARCRRTSSRRGVTWLALGAVRRGLPLPVGVDQVQHRGRGPADVRRLAGSGPSSSASTGLVEHPEVMQGGHPGRLVDGSGQDGLRVRVTLQCDRWCGSFLDPGLPGDHLPRRLRRRRRWQLRLGRARRGGARLRQRGRTHTRHPSPRSPSLRDDEG